MSSLVPVTISSETASHPRPIAAVMTEVLARYGLSESRQRPERVADYWSTRSVRADCELAVA